MNTDKLNAAISDLVKQTQQTTSVDDSATKVIGTFADEIEKAVADALAADAAANQTSIDAATTAIQTVTQQFLNSSAALGQAIATVPGTQPAPPAA